MHHQIIQRAFKELNLSLTGVESYAAHARCPFEILWPWIQTTMHAHEYRKYFRVELEKIYRAATGASSFVIIQENNSVYCPPEHCLGATRDWDHSPASAASASSSNSPSTIDEGDF
jgi:hypothetical protein